MTSGIPILSAFAAGPVAGGALVGAGFALLFWLLGFSGLDRRWGGAVSSLGLVALTAMSLGLHGWSAVAAAIPAFCLGYGALLACGGGGRGDRRRSPRRAAPVDAAPAAPAHAEPAPREAALQSVPA